MRWTSRFRSTVLGLAGMLAFGGCTDPEEQLMPPIGQPTSPAPQANDLFVPVRAQTLTLTASQTNRLSAMRAEPEIAQVYVVRLTDRAAQLLQEGQTVRFAVSPDTFFEAVGTEVRDAGGGNIYWIGEIRQGAGGYADLVFGKAGVTGGLQSGRSVHDFVPLGNGLQAITRIDLTEMQPLDPPRSGSGTLKPASSPTQVLSDWMAEPLSGEPVVDVLTVVTGKRKMLSEAMNL